MTAEGEYALKVAEFVGKNLLPQKHYPQGTEMQRLVTPGFVEHCSSKGQRLPNPQVFLEGYSGIIVAEFFLEPAEDITPFLDNRVGSEARILKRRFDLTFCAFNVAWMGIKYNGDGRWLTERSGYGLKEEPGALSFGHAITNFDLGGIERELQIGRKGIYLLESGDMRKPTQSIKVDVEMDGIKFGSF